ncbi:HEPN domain-containing protein [Nocardiopsis dassonvillei]|uniref:HEPN domain-containing protein n=1 Tax=Nocardiopsis dassonvillei TaxID=2014 RepID=UPI00102B848C
MGPSALLKSDIEKLRVVFLTPEISSIHPPDELDDRSRLLINSYVILAHAHIEEFIEDQFLSFARAITPNAGDPSIRACFTHLFISFSKKLQGDYAKKSHHDLCMAAIGHYKKLISANNGIKKKNILTLTNPLGFTEDEVTDSCNELIIHLEALGSKRGDLAHRSSVPKSATLELYPRQAQELVGNVSEKIHLLTSLLGSKVAN